MVADIDMLNLIKEMQGVFVPPIKKRYLGKLKFGTPYMYPRNFNGNIISIYKEKPKFNRNKNFKLFGFTVCYGWPVVTYRNGLGWKDKYNTPRYEWAPGFFIFFFKWQYCCFLKSPDNQDDIYWEMFLWWSRYCDKDMEKAKDLWGWTDWKTKESTWRDEYLITKTD